MAHAVFDVAKPPGEPVTAMAFVTAEAAMTLFNAIQAKLET